MAVTIELTLTEVEIIVEALKLSAINVGVQQSAQNTIIALRGGILDTDDYQQQILALSDKIKGAQNVGEG